MNASKINLIHDFSFSDYEPSNYLGGGSAPADHNYPQYAEAPEPIIEIIIQDNNETLPAPLPLIQGSGKKKKEQVQVFYVKYHKDEKSGLVIHDPIPALSPTSHNQEEEEYEEEPIIVTPIPQLPQKSTTLRTIIRPDSQQYESDSGVHVTFGSPHNDHSKSDRHNNIHDENKVETILRPILQLPQSRSGPVNTVKEKRAQSFGQSESRVVNEGRVVNGPPPNFLPNHQPLVQSPPFQRPPSEFNPQNNFISLPNQGQLSPQLSLPSQEPSKPFHPNNQFQLNNFQQQQQQHNHLQQHNLRPQQPASIPVQHQQQQGQFGQQQNILGHQQFNQPPRLPTPQAQQQQPLLRPPQRPPVSADFNQNQRPFNYHAHPTQPQQIRFPNQPGSPQIPFQRPIQNFIQDFQQGFQQGLQRPQSQQLPQRQGPPQQNFNGQNQLQLPVNRPPPQFNARPFPNQPNFPQNQGPPSLNFQGQNQGPPSSPPSSNFQGQNQGPPSVNFQGQNQGPPSPNFPQNQGPPSSNFQGQNQGPPQPNFQGQRPPQSPPPNFRPNQELNAQLNVQPLHQHNQQAQQQHQLHQQQQQHHKQQQQQHLNQQQHQQQHQQHFEQFQNNENVFRGGLVQQVAPDLSNAQHRPQSQPQQSSQSFPAKGDPGFRQEQGNFIQQSFGSEVQVHSSVPKFEHHIIETENPPVFFQPTAVDMEKIQKLSQDQSRLSGESQHRFAVNQQKQQLGVSNHFSEVFPQVENHQKHFTQSKSQSHSQSPSQSFSQSPTQSHSQSQSHSQLSSQSHSQSPSQSHLNSQSHSIQSQSFLELNGRNNFSPEPRGKEATRPSAPVVQAPNKRVETTTKRVDTTKPSPSTTRKPAVFDLPDEVPDDLREQLLSSGILENAQISVLDYDKVGDTTLQDLPAEHLANFFSAGGGAQIGASNRVISVLKPNGDSVDEKIKTLKNDREVTKILENAKKLPSKKEDVNLKVVRFDAQSQKNFPSQYIQKDSKILPSVNIEQNNYNRYLPLKINGAHFPIPDVEELRGKKISSVVVLAPVNGNDENARFERDTVEKSQIKFIAGDSLKNLLRKPSTDNFKKWLEKEQKTNPDLQSVVLLVTK